MHEHVLIVDDDPQLLKVLKMLLEAEGYLVFSAPNGHEALRLLQNEVVHLIVADIAMPGINGYQLFERISENPQWALIPFLFLTARAMDSDIRYGKELGVDDYLLKPVKTQDLLATVRGKLKRSAMMRSVVQASAAPAQRKEESELIWCGSLIINPSQYRVWLDNETVELSTKEFSLLEQLAKRPKVAQTHQDLVEVTHGFTTDPQDASQLLRPLIRTLRRKLGYQAGDMGCIENVRGVGYKFIPPIRSS
jgi:DNA-binding response OmpR family regulator